MIFFNTPTQFIDADNLQGLRQRPHRFRGPQQPVQGLDTGRRLRFPDLHQRPRGRLAVRMFCRRRHDGQTQRTHFDGGCAGRLVRVAWHRQGGPPQQGRSADGLVGLGVRIGDLAILHTANDGAIRRSGDGGQHLMDIALPVHDVEEAWLGGCRQAPRERGLAGSDRPQPFVAFFLFQASAFTLLGGANAGRANPPVEVEESQRGTVAA